MGRTEGLYGQGGCIYSARLQPRLKSASLGFNLVLHVHLLVYLEGELSLVSNTETSAFTTRCKLPVKLGATFYKELKSVKNVHTV